MRDKIHPKYHDAKVICACGKIWETKATTKEVKVGICAACHPFYTGSQKLIDTAGRIDKFQKRYANVKK